MSDENLPKIIDNEDLPQVKDGKTDELHNIEEEIDVLKRVQNHSILSIGYYLDKVFSTRLWMTHKDNYDTYNQWVADPNGVNIAPRTDRLYRLLWRVWRDKLQKISVTEEEILQIDHSKLAYVARRLKQATEPDNLLQIIHEAKTMTLRQLQDTQEEKDYEVHEFEGKCHKIFNEKSGRIYHFSQGKSRLEISAQNLWQVFGDKTVKVKMMVKKEEKDE